MSKQLPNMNLTQWEALANLFSHSQLAANMQLIDDHDHTDGKGKKVAAGGIDSLAIGTTQLQDDAVTAVKILDGTITGSKLANETIGAGQITDGAIGGPQLGVDSARVAASGPLTVGTAAADIPGATFTATSEGIYLIHAVFDLTIVTQCTAVGTCSVDGVTLAGSAILVLPDGMRATVAQQWRATGVGSGDIIKLQAIRVGGAATANTTHTTLSVLQVA
jgi:hypothetical protein